MVFITISEFALREMFLSRKYSFTREFNVEKKSAFADENRIAEDFILNKRIKRIK
jgi:hypothetical protein